MTTTKKRYATLTMRAPAYGNYLGTRSDGSQIVIDVNNVDGRPWGMTWNTATDPDNYDLNGGWTGASYDNHTANLTLIPGKDSL